MFLLLFSLACIPDFPFNLTFPDDPGHDFDGDNQTEAEGDCDDNEPLAYTGAEEVCGDLIDNDCNGDVDEYTAVDAQVWYADADGDGYGSEAYVVTACLQPEGYVAVAGDCDDTVAAINPGALELCTPEDDDCDGLVNQEDDMSDILPTYYLDADRDSWGRDDVSIEQCDRPEGYVLDAGDCDDNDPLFNPTAVEFCDGEDNDCDSLIDDADDDLQPNLVWIWDGDGDGYGSMDPSAESRQQCEQPEGFALDAGDCDDDDASIYPSAPEVCDGADQDCDGVADDGVLQSFSLDLDGDGFGGNGIVIACDLADAALQGGVDNADDCDDTVASINPAADELCHDQADNDCDGFTDEDDAIDATTWYADSDADGYGDSTRPQIACLVPSGYVDDGTDCNDALSGVNPGATEDCSTVDDDDCDGSTNTPNAIACSTFYYDEDGDNFGIADSACLCTAEAPYQAQIDTDCDDSNIDVNPGELENCSTPEDDNCNGDTNDEGASFCTYFYYDEDGDGYGLTQTSICVCTETGYYRGENPNDCDDTDQAINPAQVEVCDPDDVDENCDGLADDATAIGAQTYYVDIDSDGYGDSTPGLVLNDGRSSPMVQCDLPLGFADNGDDCNDQQISINPGMPELCSSSFDDDCDGDDNDEDAEGCDHWYADVDLDGHGSVSDSKCYCDNRDVYISASGTDCDDGDPMVNPDQSELCATSVDDNCDSQINENLAADCIQYFLDEDGDGWGVYDFICACQPQQGYEATQMGDCNDDPILNGVGQNPDLGNCGLSGSFGTDDATASVASGYYILDRNFDYNQDGNSDVLIGNMSTSNAYFEAGEAQIIFGPLNGELGNPNDADLFFAPTVTFEEHAGLYGAVGDWDGNGAPEWLVGSPENVYLFPSGMTITQPFDEDEADSVIALNYTDVSPASYFNEVLNAHQSMPLALTLGDLNNDGADELAFGRQFLTIEHYGSGNFSARISANSDGESESRILWDGADISTTESVSPTMSALRPCDIDGDGIKELVGEYRYEYGGHQNGYPWFAPRRQRIEVFSSYDLEQDPSALPLASIVLGGNGVAYDFGIPGEQNNYGSDYLPKGIGCAGDLDGDGVDELLLSKVIQTVVSDPDPFTGQVTTTVGQGHVLIWQGGTIPDSNWAISDFDTQIIGTDSYDYLGRHLSDPVDLNGDNKADLVIGGTCYGGSDGTNWSKCPVNRGSSGDTYLFYGGFPMGATYSNLDADGFLEGYTGPMYSAGDTNGDGADDLWIGNLLFMGTPF